MKTYLGIIGCMVFHILSTHATLEDTKSTLLLPFKINNFNDPEVTITDTEYNQESFESRLLYSMNLCISKGYKAIWFALPCKHASLFSTLLKHEFAVHHATAEQIVFTKWLKKNTENILPELVIQTSAVAALVIDKDNNVLAVKERYGVERSYRLPGGGINGGEQLWQAAIREVKEETGIDVEFQGVVAFRHGGLFPFAMELVSKFYVCCLLSPLHNKITIQENEIESACWLPFLEFKKVAKGIFADFLTAYEKSAGSYISYNFDPKKSTTLYSCAQPK